MGLHYKLAWCCVLAGILLGGACDDADEDTTEQGSLGEEAAMHSAGAHSDHDGGGSDKGEDEDKAEDKADSAPDLDADMAESVDEEAAKASDDTGEEGDSAQDDDEEAEEEPGDQVDAGAATEAPADEDGSGGGDEQQEPAPAEAAGEDETVDAEDDADAMMPEPMEGAGMDDAGMDDAGMDDADESVPDYGTLDRWLCHPDNPSDACAVDLDTTVVEADGTLTVEPFTPAADPPIDCFYVYPTVSLDSTPNSDWVPGPEEDAVVRAQFARFASQCRLFAPMYRQVTLTALRALIAGEPVMPDNSLGYDDVLAAWEYYLEHYNNGRGVVLVSHSQGTRVLTDLARTQLDREEVDSRFIAGLLIGGAVTVRKGDTVGGSFEHLPICQTADELGCIIAYVSFRSDSPPPADTRFAVSGDPETVVACTNPADLAGGEAPLHAYLSTDGPGASGAPMGDWVEGGAEITTPFVSVPGMLSSACEVSGDSHYLSVHFASDPSDPRTDVISGDVVTDGEIQRDWGLHLIDYHVAMGNLVDLVAAKAEAYMSRP